MNDRPEKGAPERRSVPQLRLDELLDALQVQLDIARHTRDRVHSLLEAVLAVGRELDLEQALQHIVESAASLVDARYAALGVLGPDHRLSQFLTTGITPEEVERIGPYPTGRGVLGELIRHPEPLRLSEIGEHPASVGFPPNHPPMHGFVGVPIRVRNEVFGNLYLTDKRGGGDFDADDESVLQTLAVAAGVAIDNARLYRDARLRERWVSASSEITRSLLSGQPREQVLELLVARAREIANADLGVIALPLPGGHELTIELAQGVGAEAHRGLLLPVDGSFVGAAFTSVGPVRSAEITKDPRVSAGPPRWAGMGAALAVPLGIRQGQVRGALLLARVEGAPEFSADDTASLEGFANQAALALELAERRNDAEQLALLEDRDRIARDLHDLAIQRIFATGMTLQSAQRFITHPQAADRVGRAVDDLDETVKIIRSSIFGLRTREGADASGLRARASEAVERAAQSLGFSPALRMEGLLDTDVPGDLAEEALAVLGEALSNVARHAAATAVEVVLAALPGPSALLRVQVTDNGRGLPEGGRRSGLANLADRAAGRGGELTLEAGPENGTRLCWQVPIPK